MTGGSGANEDFAQHANEEEDNNQRNMLMAAGGGSRERAEMNTMGFRQSFGSREEIQEIITH